MSEVNAFLEGQKQKQRTKEERAAIRRAEIAEEAVKIRKEFVELILPRIAALDMAGKKRYEIGCFDELPRVWVDIAREYRLRITTGNVGYLTDPPQYDYYLKWD